MERSTKIIIGVGIAVIVITVGTVVYFKVIKKDDALASGSPKDNSSSGGQSGGGGTNRATPNRGGGSTSSGGGSSENSGGSSSSTKSAFSKHDGLIIYDKNFKEGYKKNKGEFVGSVVKKNDNGMFEGRNTSGQTIYFHSNSVDLK